MRTIAYLRISTAGQDCNNQRLAILDYAHQHKMTIDEFVSIQVSSQKTLKQRGILELLDSLEPKDILLVSELSRLGRSVGQIIQMVDYLVKNQIRLVAIKESIERDLISERTKEGIAAARAKGKVIGRPKGILGKSKFDGNEDDIRLLLRKEVGITSIAKIMGVSRTTLRHFIKTRKLS